MAGRAGACNRPPRHPSQPPIRTWWHRLPACDAGKETAVIVAVLEEPMTFVLEIVKFLGTVALILVTGLLLLMAG